MDSKTTGSRPGDAELAYPCGKPPVTGIASEVAPGVWWMRMPLPFELDHINVWALEDQGGFTLVDTGIGSPDTAAAWRKLFGGPLDGPVKRILVTHMHPDHVGMAGWLARKFDCDLWMSRLEYLNCRVLAADTGREAPEDAVQFYQRAGWNDEGIEHYRTRFGGFGKMLYPLPDSYHRLSDGEEIDIGGRGWRVVVGTGHSPEHACLYCPELKLLISGDQVLPRISSNVSVFPTEPDANPLADWLGSLDKLEREIPDDVLVLPAHNEPFRGLHARIEALRQSVDKALARLREVLREPRRATDVYGALFARPIGSGQFQLSMLATGESLAHLNYLVARGEASAQLGDDRCTWYRMAG